MYNFCCISVVGGWQTAVVTAKEQVYSFGPSFNDIRDLWKWQKENLPSK